MSADIQVLLTKFHVGDTLSDEELATLLREANALAEVAQKFGAVMLTTYRYANDIRMTLQGFARARRERRARPMPVIVKTKDKAEE